MLAAGILLAVLLALLVFLLMSPFELHIDTVSERYLLRWRGIASIRLIGGVDDPGIRLWVLGWRKTWRLLNLPSPGKEKKEPAEKKQVRKKKKKGKRPRWLTLQLIWRLIQTFKVRRLRLDLDTDDFVLNAWMFPCLNLLSGSGRQLNINFQGKNELILVVTNRIADLLWAFLREIFRRK